MLPSPHAGPLTATGLLARQSLGGFAAIAGGWSVAAACAACEAPDRPAAVVSFVASLPFWAAVVAVVRSDLADFIIPDGASLAIALLGLAQALAAPLVMGGSVGDGAAAGLAAIGTGTGGFLLFWVVGAAVRRVRRREALGFGDVKLAGALAIWLSAADAALALEIASLGAIAALLFLRRRGADRDTAVPFGAFMAPAAWLVYAAGPALRDLWS